jgi:hypothetical protein
MTIVPLLSLWIDGIEGEEVARTDSWQYARGRTCEDGPAAIYRRRASDVGTYGGWRWECDTRSQLDALLSAAR